LNVGEDEELSYFKNNGIDTGHGRKARSIENFQSMVKPMESGNEEV